MKKIDTAQNKHLFPAEKLEILFQIKKSQNTSVKTLII